MGKEIVKLGGNTFQFFTRNPRGGAAKPIDERDIEAFKTFAKENNINIILAHAPYTLNACSADADVRNFAKQVFADDLKRMEYIPGNMYNFHPGSHDNRQGILLHDIRPLLAGIHISQSCDLQMPHLYTAICMTLTLEFYHPHAAPMP